MSAIEDNLRIAPETNSETDTDAQVQTMKTADVDILIVPGWAGSEPDHWQSRWENRLATARKIEQDDWHTPKRSDWTARIIAEVRATTRPVVLVAHSLGVHAVAHASAELKDSGVVGAFLVTPPSEHAIRAIPGIDPDFAPFHAASLPFKAVLIASRDDPYATYEETSALGDIWGAKLVDAGMSNHINTASGHGPWPEGLMSFAAFLQTL
jgi:uncharacterized protein